MTNISIIMPIYNSEKTLEKALKSLVLQKNCSLEIICIDDNSNDNSVKVVKNFNKTYNNIKLITNPQNIGTAACRNIAIDNATGEYILNLDSDDYLEPESLCGLLNYAKKLNTDMCFINAKLIFTDEKSNRNIPTGVVGEYNDIYSGKDLMDKFLNNNEFFLRACSWLYKRKYIKENKLRYKHLKIGEGGEFIIRALINAKKVAVYNKIIYNYCINSNSISNSHDSTINLLIGQLTQLKTIWEEYNKNKLNVLKKLDAKIRQEIIGKIASLDSNQIKYIKEKISNDFVIFIFNNLIAYRDAYNIVFSDVEIKKLNDFKYIYIYGSGFAATESIAKLSEINKKISGVVISELNEKKVIMGHDVTSIKDIRTLNDDSLFIICANSKFKANITNTLNKYGFYNYIDLNITI